MAIEVEGPDGSIHEFPDGTTPDVIKGVMSKRYSALSPEMGAKTAPAPSPTPAAEKPAPKIAREGFFTAEYDDGSIGLGPALRPIVEGVKKALPAAARYQPGSGDSAALTDVIEAVLPPAAALSPVTPGRMTTSPISSIWKDGTARSSQMSPTIPPKIAPKDLKSAAQAAYKQADDAGVIYAPQGVGRIAAEIGDDLAEFGYHPSLQPRIKTVLDELGRVSEGNVTMKGMDTIRKITRNAAQSADPSERALGSMIIDRIDDLMMNPRAGETVFGNAEQASGALREARTLWSRMRKTELIEDAVGRADLRAASTGSGGNTQNAIRQNLRGILDNPKKARMFSPQERTAIESVVRGTTALNSLRLIGKLSPEGNGLMLGLGLGATAASPPMIAAPIAGLVAKRLADRGMNKSVERLMAMVSSGQPAKVAANWGDIVGRYRAGSATEGALRMTTLALARQLSRETGESEPDIAQALMEAATSVTEET